MAELEAVIRDVIRNALDASPSLLPKEGRYADYISQRLGKDQVADEIARELVSNGWLPFNATDLEGARTLSNFHAVSYTMGQMRGRLLNHIRGGGRDPVAERDALSSIAMSFFGDLEARGWRLVRTMPPRPMGAHFNATGFVGKKD